MWQVWAASKPNGLSYAISTRVIEPGQRLHSPVSSICLSAGMLAYAVSAAKGWPVKLPDRTELLPLTGCRIDYSIALPFNGPVEAALAGKKFGRMEIGLFAPGALENKPAQHELAHAAGLDDIVYQAITPALIDYVGACSEWLNANGHAQVWGRPEVLNFGRVVRNAAAHRGRLYFEPSKKPRPAVEWRGVRIDPETDHDRAVIGTELWAGDLVGLLFEMDDAMAELGAGR